MTWKVVVSMKWAMFVVSEVFTRIFPSATGPFPPARPHGDLGQDLVLLDVDDRDLAVVLVGHVERIAGRSEDELLRIRP